MLILIVTIFLVTGFPKAAEANPAYNVLKTYVQPNHTKIECRLMGDERFNWRETLESDIILLSLVDYSIRNNITLGGLTAFSSSVFFNKKRRYLCTVSTSA